MKFGAKLQALRTDAGWSQEELAARLGVSRQAVSKWELDKTVPDAATIVAVSELFRVSTDYLLKDGERAAPPRMQAQAPPPQAPVPASRNNFSVAAVCAVALMLAADVLYTVAFCFYIRELYPFSTAFLLLVMAALPVLLVGWRARLRTASSGLSENCRKTVSAGARLWCFGLMLLCGFDAFIHDMFISPGMLAFMGDFLLVVLSFGAVILGLWAVGRLSAWLFTRNLNT